MQSKFSDTLSTLATKHIGLSITRCARLSRLELTGMVSVVFTITVNAAVVTMLAKDEVYQSAAIEDFDEEVYRLGLWVNANDFGAR